MFLFRSWCLLSCGIHAAQATGSGQDTDCHDEECSLLQQGILNERPYNPSLSAIKIKEGPIVKATAVEQYKDGKLKLTSRQLEIPDGSSLLIVRILTASVNAWDWRPNYSATNNAYSMYFTPWPGFDYAGTVVAKGSDPMCDRLIVDSAVWGYHTGGGSGTWADYVLASCYTITAAPVSVGPYEYGLMPYAGLFAQQVLIAAGALQWKDYVRTVLVLGGANDVGFFAVQLARAFGAHKVIMTCSKTNAVALPKMVPTFDDVIMIPHITPWWLALGKDSVDVVLDTIGEPQTGDHAFFVLRRHGKFLSTVGGAAMASKATQHSEGVTQEYVFFGFDDDTDRHKLQELYKNLEVLQKFVDAHQVRGYVSANFTLETAAQAMAMAKEDSTGAQEYIGKIRIFPPGVPH